MSKRTPTQQTRAFTPNGLLPTFNGKVVLTVDQLAEKQRDPQAFQRKYFPKVEKETTDDKKKPRKSTEIDKVNGTQRRKSYGKTTQTKSQGKQKMTVEEKMKLMQEMKQNK